MRLVRFIVVASMVLMYGCSSLPSVEKMQSEVSGYTLLKPAVADKGLVYVVRPSNAGGLVRFNVFLNGRKDESEVGCNRGNQYIYFYVIPGKHKISSKAENWADLELDVSAGEVVFIKQEVEVGILMARNSLVLLNETEGSYLVKEASLGSVVKEH